MNDKQAVAIKLCGSMDDDVIIKSLSIADRTYRKWTQNKREQLEKERDSKVVELWLQCGTMEDIGKLLSVDKSTVSRIIEKLQNGKIAELQQINGFQPQLYNIWNFAKNNNETPIKIIEQIIISFLNI